ncbi:MAG: hypothetical protein AB6733_14930 [Clostridiaceae bacterium]
MLTEDDKTYDYDANGSLISSKDKSAEITYSYNFNNKLTKINGATSIEYQYDISGNRISANENSKITKYLVDNNRENAEVLEEQDDKGNAVVKYTYGNDLISQTRSGKNFYYIYDGQGSTRALTSDDGKVTDTYDYDAFGNISNRTGDTENNYLYTGQQYDSNSGFYYFRKKKLFPVSSKGSGSNPIIANNYWVW